MVGIDLFDLPLKEKRLTYEDEYDRNLNHAWSPDGKQFVMVGHIDGTNQRWMKVPNSLA